MKLGIFWPWDSPFTWTQFTENALNLERPEGVEIRFFRGRGWCSARRHSDGCEKALAWGADLLLCIGSDQTYPEDLIPRLLKRREQTDGAIIACMVPFRGFVAGQNMKPFQPMAWKIVGDGARPFRGMDKDPDMLVQIKREDGDLQRAHVIGTGVLLFSSEQLNAIKKPWFYDKINLESAKLTQDMDAQFIWRLQMEGHAKLYVDTTIMVKHLHAFLIDDSFQHRFEDWQENPNA